MINLLAKAKPAILSEGNVYVSNKIVIIGNIAFLVNNISSFGHEQLPNVWRWILAGVGVLTLLGGLGHLTSNPLIALFGIALVAIAFFIPHKYGVLVESNSGARRFIASTNKDFINRLTLSIYMASNSGFGDKELKIFNIESASISTGDVYKNISGSQILVRSTINDGANNG
ncbi:DUF6232 family protein [Solidesulfovibrio sp.]|uniref:DUF6232 family protein n=1 Tax=Solidesulfovibrio sp. TaxID=2910990 RepID=UPI002B205A64|nr:DUF6232 family protein [Solidesulfovibrio sp.]MEA4857506.1 DUF6232 family protein [Solidesulfovibrio sp.]